MGSAALRANGYGGKLGRSVRAARQGPYGAGAPMAVGKLLMAVGELPMGCESSLCGGQAPYGGWRNYGNGWVNPQHRIRSPAISAGASYSAIGFAPRRLGSAGCAMAFSLISASAHRH